MAEDDLQPVLMSVEVRDAIDRFIAEELPLETRAGAMLMIVTDWLIGHGYLELPPDKEDMN